MNDLDKKYAVARVRQVAAMLFVYATFYVCRLAFSASKKLGTAMGTDPSGKREGSFSMEDRRIGGWIWGLARCPCNSPVSPVSPVLPAKIHSIIPQPLRLRRRRLSPECERFPVGWRTHAAKNEWRVAAVAGGFIDVKDSIVIYTDAVEWSEDIDMERVLSEKAKVEDWLGKHPDADEDSAEMQNAKRMLAKAETRTNVADGGHRH